MTSPVTVPAISPAVAPVAERTAPVTSRDAIQDAIGEAWRETMVTQGTPETELVRDEKGRFVPREESEPTTDNTDGTVVAESAPEETATGKDGETVVLPEADPAHLATNFTLKDQSGELAIPAGLMVTFNANGKTRELPLDRVVKFAEMGFYNHEREQMRQVTESRAQEIATRAQGLENQLAKQDRQLEALLSDPNFYQRAVQEFQQQNTPEAQAQRFQVEREQFRLEQERASIAPVNQRYLEQEIGPSVDMVTKALPNVEAREVTERLERFIRTKQGRGGYVDPSQHKAINDYFLNEIVPWAKQLDEFRAIDRGTQSGRQKVEASKQQATKESDELAAQRARAQKVRRQAAQNLTPPTRGAPGTPVAPKPIRNHSDAVSSAVDTALAITLGRA